MACLSNVADHEDCAVSVNTNPVVLEVFYPNQYGAVPEYQAFIAYGSQLG